MSITIPQVANSSPEIVRYILISVVFCLLKTGYWPDLLAGQKATFTNMFVMCIDCTGCFHKAVKLCF